MRAGIIGLNWGRVHVGTLRRGFEANARAVALMVDVFRAARSRPEALQAGLSDGGRAVALEQSIDSAVAGLGA